MHRYILYFTHLLSQLVGTIPSSLATMPHLRVLRLEYNHFIGTIPASFRSEIALHCTALHGTARHGTARHGTARHGTAWHYIYSISYAVHCTYCISCAFHCTYCV